MSMITHCSLVMAWTLVQVMACCRHHQAITHVNFDLSIPKSCDIHLNYQGLVTFTWITKVLWHSPELPRSCDIHMNAIHRQGARYQSLNHVWKLHYHPHLAPRESSVNSLWSNDAIRRQRSGSTLAQVMTCWLMAPSHYLNQCWLIISKVKWH